MILNSNFNQINYEIITKISYVIIYHRDTFFLSKYNTNYPITFVIWPEIYESSNMVAHPWEYFFEDFSVFQILFFLQTRSNIMMCCEGFPLSSFFELLTSISKYGQNWGHDRSYLGVKSCKTLGVSLIKYILVCVKTIFLENHEETTKHV